jgi:hypothetical protein
MPRRVHALKSCLYSVAVTVWGMADTGRMQNWQDAELAGCSPGKMQH